MGTLPIYVERLVKAARLTNTTDWIDAMGALRYACNANDERGNPGCGDTGCGTRGCGNRGSLGEMAEEAVH